MAANTLNGRTMIEMRLVFDDNTQSTRVWTWADVQAGRKPEFDQPDWMREPRKTWQHPQDPIIYSALVEPGRERDARDWLEAL